MTIFIFLVIGFQLLGCSETTDNDTSEEIDTSSAATLITEPIPIKPTPEETFEKLKTLFPKPIFDEEFTTLGEVTTTKTYLDFLTQEYRTEKPFKTLTEYLTTIAPDPERYTPFLKESIGKADKEDIAIIHQMTSRYRCANAILYQQVDHGNVLAILDVLEKKLSILEEGPIRDWLDGHVPNQKQVFFTDFENFVFETEKTDTLLIKEQFEKHGKDNGILWVALRNPALTAEILNNFTNTDAFLKWINGDFFIEEP